MREKFLSAAVFLFVYLPLRLLGPFWLVCAALALLHMLIKPGRWLVDLIIVIAGLVGFVSWRTFNRYKLARALDLIRLAVLLIIVAYLIWGLTDSSGTWLLRHGSRLIAIVCFIVGGEIVVRWWERLADGVVKDRLFYVALIGLGLVFLVVLIRSGLWMLLPIKP